MKFTLPSKISVLIIAITLITSASLNLVFREAYRKNEALDIEEHVMEIARLRAWNLAQRFVRKEYQQIYDEISGDIFANKNVVNIQFYD
jgi:hypothetical protein